MTAPTEPRASRSQSCLSLIGAAALIAVCALIFFAFAAMTAGSSYNSVMDEVNATLEAQGVAPLGTPRTAASTRAPVATPRPRPITLSGRGDSVVDVDKPAEASIARITHSGDGNFIVTSYNTDGTRNDLLVNTIGRYEGTVPLDFGNSHTGRFEVTAGGAWEITILSALHAPRFDAPGTYEGRGDTVLIITGGDRRPDTLSIDARGTGNLIIHAYGNGRDLLVNQIAPYSGRVIIPANVILSSDILGQAAFLTIRADGAWSITADAR